MSIIMFTGSRADFYLLYPLYKALSKKYDIKFLVSGGHLDKDQGYTLDLIKSDSSVVYDVVPFSYDKDINKCNDKAFLGTTIASALEAFSLYLKKETVDLFIVLGDRYEAFAATLAANLQGICILHLHGGEESEGAQDNYFRHCMTKLSTYHFVSCENYRQRVISMGENPQRVFNVGALGVYNVVNTKKCSKDDIYKELNINDKKDYFLITYHPVTLDTQDPKYLIDNLLGALDCFSKYNLIFSAANADLNGNIFNDAIKAYCKEHDNAYFFYSLGMYRYINAMRHASLILGNSSSAIIEAPSVNCHILDIGDRQKGRDRAFYVQHCNVNLSAIVDGINGALAIKEKHLKNPYYNDKTLDSMVEAIALFDTTKFVQKPFYSIR